MNKVSDLDFLKFLTDELRSERAKLIDRLEWVNERIEENDKVIAEVSSEEE